MPHCPVRARFGTLFFGCLCLFASFSFAECLHGLSAPLQAQAFTSLSAASFENNLTPEGIAAGFSANLAPSNATATVTPLPTTLNGVSVTVNGVSAGLFFVSPNQINYQIPAGLAAGNATVNVSRNGALTHTGKLNIVAAAPALFTANGNGLGVPTAFVTRVADNGAQTIETIAQLVNNRWQTKAKVTWQQAFERLHITFWPCMPQRWACDPALRLDRTILSRACADRLPEAASTAGSTK